MKGNMYEKVGGVGLCVWLDWVVVGEFLEIEGEVGGGDGEREVEGRRWEEGVEVMKEWDMD